MSVSKRALHLLSHTEQGKVRNLRVSEESTDSFRVTWMAAPGAVVRYRLTYVPARGDHPTQETTTAGPETTIVLTRLMPTTTYRVTVAAEYGAGPGPAMQVDGTTKEGESLRAFKKTKNKKNKKPHNVVVTSLPI